MIVALISLLLLCSASFIGTLIVRWLANRPEAPDMTPITDEELYREKPEHVMADFSYEYIDPLLESVEVAVDGGFTERQRQSLATRVNHLDVRQITYAIYPVQYRGACNDLLMHFVRLDDDHFRCRLEANAPVIDKMKELVARLPRKANTANI